MIEIGRKQPLMVVKRTEFGVYLGTEQDKVLLPSKFVEKDVEVGDSIFVFVYRDSKDRLIATTLEPKITLGQIAKLKVKQVNNICAFLDWGLEKDLFLMIETEGQCPPGRRIRKSRRSTVAVSGNPREPFQEISETYFPENPSVFRTEEKISEIRPAVVDFRKKI